MRTIGLIGGMSWESSAEYYRIMNQTVKQRLGGLHSASILMRSVDFAPIRTHMLDGDWDGIGERLAAEARSLERGGADCVVIGTNTMHKVAPQVAAAVEVPLIHIADATADAVLAIPAARVGLLGTAFTMEHDFYTGRLAEHGVETLTPAGPDRRLVDAVIFDELCQGRFEARSRQEYLRVINDLVDQGAEAVVLGCTEIGLLLGDAQVGVPLLDTCRIHAEQAVEFALADVV